MNTIGTPPQGGSWLRKWFRGPSLGGVIDSRQLTRRSPRKGSMPWKGSAACVYDKASIVRSAPTNSGVYVILSGGRWLYVGESGSIRGSLSLQFSGVNPSIMASEPTHFMYELVPDADRAARRRELILEFQPECQM